MNGDSRVLGPEQVESTPWLAVIIMLPFLLFLLLASLRVLLYRLWEAEVGGSGRRSAVDYADGLIEVLVLGCRLELWRSCTCLTTTGFEVADYCYECYCTTLTTFTFCSFSLLSGRGGLL